MMTGASPAFSSTSPRLAALDGLRGCAALAVVLFHFFVVYRERSGGVPGDHSVATVLTHLFFLISGFSIGLALTRTVRAVDFVLARCTRIFPLYWIALALALGLTAWAGLPNPAPTSRDLGLNAALLQGAFGAPDLTGVAGVLVPELIFYLLVLVVFRAGWLEKFEWVAAIWLALAFTGFALRAFFALPGWLGQALLLEHAHLFVAGLLFQRLQIHGISAGRLWLLALCLAAQHLLHGFLAGFALVVAFPLFLMLAWNQLGGFRARPFVFLGSISYALFLVHENVGYALIHAVTKTGGPYLGGVFLGFAGSVALATILTFAVERPLRALIHGKRPAHLAADPEASAPNLEASNS